MYLNVYMYVYINMYVYVHMYIYTYTYMYIYIYTYTYIHTYVYILHIYVHRSAFSFYNVCAMMLRLNLFVRFVQCVAVCCSV